MYLRMIPSSSVAVGVDHLMTFDVFPSSASKTDPSLMGGQLVYLGGFGGLDFLDLLQKTA